MVRSGALDSLKVGLMTLWEMLHSVSFLGTSDLLWLALFALVALLLAFDLGVLHRRSHAIGIRESLLLSAGYIGMGLLFGLWVYAQKGPAAGLDYFSGFVLEKSLSLDNVFVMALIFNFLKIPREYQHRVLFWGILGAIVLRGLLIGLGSALVAKFGWLMYGFGAFLLISGVRMLRSGDESAPDLSHNVWVRGLKRVLPISDELSGERFWLRKPDAQGRLKLWLTPLFLALMLIEGADLIFALDSVPAIFAITLDPFVIFSSNIFAILGLRALYFTLAALLHRFAYLKYALALVLVFVGGKIFWIGFVSPLPTWLPFSVILSLLAGGVALSLYKTKNSA